MTYCGECAETNQLTINHEIPGHPYSLVNWEAMPQREKRNVIRKVIERDGTLPEYPTLISYGSFLERLQWMDGGGPIMQLPRLEQTLSVKCRCGHNPQASPERVLQESVRTIGDTLYLRS